jgi:hypothetical protein
MAEEAAFDGAGPLAAVPLGWWLEVRCGCGQMRQIPIGLLLRRHGPGARAAELVARMRCARCGSPLASAEWIDNPQDGVPGSGYPVPHRVPVAS